MTLAALPAAVHSEVYRRLEATKWLTEACRSLDGRIDTRGLPGVGLVGCHQLDTDRGCEKYFEVQKHRVRLCTVRNPSPSFARGQQQQSQDLAANVAHTKSALRRALLASRNSCTCSRFRPNATSSFFPRAGATRWL